MNSWCSYSKNDVDAPPSTLVTVPNSPRAALDTQTNLALGNLSTTHKKKNNVGVRQRQSGRKLSRWRGEKSHTARNHNTAADTA